LFVTAEWRRRDAERRLAVWEPLIGREATVTATRSLTVGRATFLIALAWVIGFIAFQVVSGERQGVAYAVIFIVGMIVMITGFTRAVRLFIQAQRQAALVAGTTDKARPPVTDPRAFRRWQGRSQYARHSQPEA